MQRPLIAVSPVIGGKAVKGPTAKMLHELGLEVSAAEVARHYQGFLDGYVIDDADAGLCQSPPYSDSGDQDADAFACGSGASRSERRLRWLIVYRAPASSRKLGRLAVLNRRDRRSIGAQPKSRIHQGGFPAFGRACPWQTIGVRGATSGRSYRSRSSLAPKQRLAALLSPRTAARTCGRDVRGCARGVVGVARGLAGIVVVTVDPTASEIALRYGAKVWTDGARDGHTGAVTAAAHRLAANGLAMLTMPGDIPRVTAADVATCVGGASARRGIHHRAGLGRAWLQRDPVLARRSGPLEIRS